MARIGRASGLSRMLGLIALVATVAGCALHVELPTQTGRATAVENAISITTDDWTYGVPLDGVMWMDQDGLHKSGRPTCLEPGPDRPVKFAATEVTVEGTTWRPVVWVDCR